MSDSGGTAPPFLTSTIDRGKSQHHTTAASMLAKSSPVLIGKEIG
jgi:hypothetical protein